MPIFRLLQHAIILLYVSITASAFLFTMTRIRIPGIPRPLLSWSYGMMAPYQGDSEWNTDFIAEGRSGAHWTTIDLDRYIPTGFGERNVRKYLRTFKGNGIESHRQAFQRVAEKLLVRERAAGRPFESLRIIEQRWPRSPEGFDALRRKPFMEEAPVIEVQ